MRKILIQIVGSALTIGLFFAVLFDPTETALGSSLVTLPPFALSAAEILGNVTWLIGLTYFFVTALFAVILFSDTTRELYAAAVIKNGGASAFEQKWHTYIRTPIFSLLAIVAIGSGFWFTGFFWLAGIWMAYALCAEIRNNSPTYKAHKAYKAEQAS